MKTELNFLLDHAPWPAFLVDEGGTIRRANEAAREAFGNGLEGDSALLSGIWATDNEFGALQFLARWERSAHAMVPIKFRCKGAVTKGFTACLCSCYRDGQKRVLFQLFREALPQPAPTTAAASQGAQAMEGQKQKLDCALQLTRTVALDFNNALTSILGHSSLVLSQIDNDNPWRNSLVEIEKAAGRAAEIAHHLASFSHPDKEPQQLSVGNLNPLLQRVVQSFQQNRPDPIQWYLKLDDCLHLVRFDEAKIQQALIKVLENAVQAVHSGGKVFVCSRNVELTEPLQDGALRLQSGSYACVEVTDTGHGIAYEILPRIFEPFFSTRPGHRGLGLAWVYGVLTNHGGGVAVSSQQGKGTAVRLYLPSTKLPVRDRAVPRPALSSGKEIILMVDDEESILAMGQTVLSSHGYQVVTSTSGEKALEILAKNESPIDLVITDLVMPQMSGRELIEQLRCFCPETPIICTTGYLRAANIEERETCLQKPFTSQDLLHAVEVALGKQEVGPTAPSAANR